MKNCILFLFLIIAFNSNAQDGTVLAENGVILGNNTGSVDGTIRYTGTEFEGRSGGLWEALGSLWEVNGADLFYNLGRVGVGTNTPLGPLHVIGGDSFLEGELYVGGTSLVSNTWVMGHFQNPNFGVGSGILLQAASSGFGFGDGAQISVSDGVNPDLHVANWEDGGIAFKTGAFYSTHMYLDNSGNLSLGAIGNATGYKLSVDGFIICEEVRVEDSGNWPDYVFGNDYSLMSLSDLQKFITINHHLPNIPTASEIEESGIAVGEMQKKMMEKIEELTLYILQQEERIKVLEAAIDK